jgi:hypothetical protein
MNGKQKGKSYFEKTFGDQKPKKVDFKVKDQHRTDYEKK